MERYELIDKNEYCALDLETTSLVPAASRIIEIAIIRFSGKKVIQEFSSLVKPGVDIPEKASQITGITAETVANAPHIKDIWPKILETIGDCPLIAHNAPFDLGFLGYAGFREGLEIPDVSAFDTLALARKLLKTPDGFKVEAFRRRYGLDERKEHRALEDTKVCHEIFLECMQAAADHKNVVDHGLINKLTNIQGGPLSMKKFIHAELELPPRVQPIVDSMMIGKSIWITYGGDKRPRHVVPTYMYENQSGILMKAYNLEDQKYKDYYALKLDPIDPPPGAGPPISWAGPIL